MTENEPLQLGMNRIVMPCPFCGGTKVNIIEGLTFRWRRAECQECEAMAGAVRVQTMGDGTDEEWETEAADEAFKQWNKRALRETVESRRSRSNREETNGECF
jgi:Lar family restriction alleviation protein